MKEIGYLMQLKERVSKMSDEELLRSASKCFAIRENLQKQLVELASLKYLHTHIKKEKMKAL